MEEEDGTCSLDGFVIVVLDVKRHEKANRTSFAHDALDDVVRDQSGVLVALFHPCK